MPFIFRLFPIGDTGICPTLIRSRMASARRSPNPCQSCSKTRHIFDPSLCLVVFCGCASISWKLKIYWWKSKLSKTKPIHVEFSIFQPLVFREMYIEADLNGIQGMTRVFHWFSIDVMSLAETRRESEGDFPIKKNED